MVVQEPEAYTRVLSVRGRTGAVLGLEPAAGESSQDISSCLTKCLPEAGLLQVEHIASDSPSTKLFRALKEICINLEGLSLDPTHAAMRYEQALGGKKSRGSHLLRSFMTKFTTHDPAVTSNIWGPWYQGGAAPPLTAQEQALRHHIQERSFSKIRASKVLVAAEKLVAWPTRIQFVEALAALTAAHPEDMGRKLEGTKMTVGKLLYQLTDAEKMEWLFNNLRYRQGLPPEVRMLLPSGTTSNEALHAEMNGWFRQVQAMHRTTLVLKLQVQGLGKLLAHQTALHAPTTMQLPHSLVLAAASCRPLWTPRSWRQWTQSQRDSGAAPLPLKKRKQQDKERIGPKVKRPAAKQRKRTPFTLERAAGIVRTGVHKRRPRST